MKSPIWVLGAAAMLVAAFGPTAAQARHVEAARTRTPPQEQVAYVPIRFRTVSGIRPFVDVRMNGKPFLFMVHSNASFYAMTTHANAASAGITNLQKKTEYGIAAPGTVSSLGRAETTLGKLEVGSVLRTDVPLSVFEVPVDDMQGMLGTRWLKENRVIVDYDRYRIGISPTRQTTIDEDRRLVASGYIAHPMMYDGVRRVYSVYAVVNGVPTWLVVSTVGANVIDSDFAAQAHIPVGPVVDQFAGPKGATGDSTISRRPVKISLDGQEAAAMIPSIQDLYAYSNEARPPKPDDTFHGMLGADFMLANGAVIDFGSSNLFLPKAGQP